MDNIMSKIYIKASNIYRTLMMIGIAIALAYLCYHLLILILPPDVVTFNTAEQVVVDKEVKRGETVKIIMDFCKHLPLKPMKVETKLQDSVIWDLTPTAVFVPQEIGCRKQELEIRIPEVVPADEKVRIIRQYYFQISPFLPLAEEKWVSEEFTITD